MYLGRLSSEIQATLEVAQRMRDLNNIVWDGNCYSLSVTERLGVEENGGMVRVGPTHYNTLEEIERFGEALRDIIQPV